MDWFSHFPFCDLSSPFSPTCLTYSSSRGRQIPHISFFRFENFPWPFLFLSTFFFRPEDNSYPKAPSVANNFSGERRDLTSGDMVLEPFSFEVSSGLFTGTKYVFLDL